MTCCTFNSSVKNSSYSELQVFSHNSLLAPVCHLRSSLIFVGKAMSLPLEWSQGLCSCPPPLCVQVRLSELILFAWAAIFQKFIQCQILQILMWIVIVIDSGCNKLACFEVNIFLQLCNVFLGRLDSISPTNFCNAQRCQHKAKRSCSFTPTFLLKFYSIF